MWTRALLVLLSSVFGSDSRKETQALFAGVDVVVTTPFRLILHLGKADMVLNEASERGNAHQVQLCP